MQSLELFESEVLVESRLTGFKYCVTNFGRVFRKPCKYRPNWREIKGEINHGYARVNLSFGQKSTKFRVHRLVAEAFIDNPLAKPFVNHKDGNKLNNHISNLEWCTSSENERHSFDVLGKVGNKTKPEHVRQSAISLRKSGLKLREIAKHLDVSIRYVKYVMQSCGKLNLT